ncbi:MAG: DUF6494 family protein [Paracoccaceae bacterium]
MNDEEFNMSMRKFLKQVGVTSQQEIEAALRKAKAEAKLPVGSVRARMVLTIDEIGMSHVVEGDIKTGGAA